MCFLALSAGSNVELDTLALLQRLVAVTLNVGVVNEDVFATLARNESEALLGIEELHGTCSQLSLISSNCPPDAAGDENAIAVRRRTYFRSQVEIGRVERRDFDGLSTAQRLDR